MDNIIYINFRNRVMIQGNHAFITLCRETISEEEVQDVIDAILDPGFYNISSNMVQKLADLYFGYYAHQHC